MVKRVKIENCIFFHDYAHFISCKGPESVMVELVEISRAPFVLIFKCYIHATCDHRFCGGGGQAHKLDHDHSHTHGTWRSTSQSMIPFNMTILDTVPKQMTFKLNFNTFITYLLIIYIFTHIHISLLYIHIHTYHSHIKFKIKF